MARRGNLSRMRPRCVNALVECSRRAHQRFERHGARQIGKPHQSPGARHCQRAHGRHCLRAVQQSQAFFGGKLEWLQAGPLQRFTAGNSLALIERFALADNDQREVRQRSQIAARTHASLLRNHGAHAGVEHRHQKFRNSNAAAACALGEHVGSQQQHGPRFRNGKRRTDSAGVTAHQVGLQFSQLLVGNAHI